MKEKLHAAGKRYKFEQIPDHLKFFLRLLYKKIDFIDL